MDSTNARAIARWAHTDVRCPHPRTRYDREFSFFQRRLNWFIENRHDVAERNVASMKARGKGNRLLLALASKERLVQILKRMLDETEFLADHGIRSLSKFHKDRPYSMNVNGQEFKVEYLPGESDSGLFGGNSNWRGPIWLCVNFLLVESLLRFYMFYGESLQVECPTGSGDFMHLGHVAEEIQHRLQHLMARGDDGRRAVNNGNDMLDFDQHWQDYLWFYEYFVGHIFGVILTHSSRIKSALAYLPWTCSLT